MRGHIYGDNYGYYAFGQVDVSYRIIIFSEGALEFIGLSTEKWSSLNRLYHWQSTSPYYTEGESEKVCRVQGK